MWPIQLAFRFLISCRIFLCSLPLINISSFLTWSVQLIFSILLLCFNNENLCKISNISSVQWLLCDASRYRSLSSVEFCKSPVYTVARITQVSEILPRGTGVTESPKFFWFAWHALDSKKSRITECFIVVTELDNIDSLCTLLLGKTPLLDIFQYYPTFYASNSIILKSSMHFTCLASIYHNTEKNN
jgi:hypothetical protein